MPDNDNLAHDPQTGPVHLIPGDEDKGPQPGIALCLSGGGYRAMLFHAGTVMRLNEAGLLPRLDRVSSVSGGSITAGVLALAWPRLAFDAAGVSPKLADEVIAPIRRMAGKTVDVGSVIIGALGPGSVSDRVRGAYEKYLFGKATLQDLPADGAGPRFVINATNLQSGVLWRFSRPRMADWRVGTILNPTVSLAAAVAASSAFPPVLSPAVLDLDPDDFQPGSGTDLTGREYRDEVFLTDGGVYDNLGLETAWKRYQTVLVSDGGGRLEPDPDPSRDWGRGTYRVLSVIDSQVRSLRKRQVVGSFKRGERTGAYWSIWTDAAEYKVNPSLQCPREKTQPLAAEPTRLKAVPPQTQDRLINWGYAACDCALRAYYDKSLPMGAFPFAGGVG